MLSGPQAKRLQQRRHSICAHCDVQGVCPHERLQAISARLASTAMRYTGTLSRRRYGTICVGNQTSLPVLLNAVDSFAPPGTLCGARLLVTLPTNMNGTTSTVITFNLTNGEPVAVAASRAQMTRWQVGLSS